MSCRTVIASLWAVDDAATQQLMSRFYEGLWDRKGPLGKVEALRRAQLEMLRAGPPRNVERPPPAGPAPPYYWAAFVLSGDWR